MSEAAKRWLAGAVLVLATLAVHAPRDGGFAYDDDDFVVANQSIRSLAGAIAALAMPFPPEQPERGLYRPLTNLSYAVDHALWGPHAAGFHLSNALLYALLVLAVARLSMVYMGSLGFAFSVALLFAMSPVHCEAVDNVAGRSEILALLWSVVSLLCFLRGTHDTRSDRHWLAASAGAYALACASKETGVVLPVVLAVHRLALSPPPPGSGLRRWLSDLRPLLPHAAVLVAYLVLRGVVLGRFSPAASILLDSGLIVRFATIGTVYLLNLVLLIWPPLEVDFYYQAVVGLPSRVTGLAVLGWLALLASAGAALCLARRHFADAIGEHSRARATALCGVSIFATTLLPTSHLFDMGALAAERFLFAPSLGFLILLVLAVRQLLGFAPSLLRRSLGAALLLSVAAVGAWRSHERAAEWRDPQRLWREAARSLPRDERVHTNLAAVLIERGQFDDARKALDIALILKPGYGAALGNLATLDLEEGRLEDAAATYQRMLELDPNDFLTWYNLGRLELARGHNDLARLHFQRSIEINPNFSHARLGLEATGRP